MNINSSPSESATEQHSSSPIRPYKTCWHQNSTCNPSMILPTITTRPKHLPFTKIYT